MKKKFSEKLGKTNNETQNVKSPKGSKFLITINVLGSAGPLRFVVNGDDLVAGVIDTALKSYARGGRLPVLGSDVNDFVLYSADAGFDGIITFPFARISTHQFFASYVVNKTSAFSTLMNKIFPRILWFLLIRINCLLFIYFFRWELFVALNPNERISSCGGRNFVLCKKQRQPQMTEARSEMIAQKRSGSWKAWLNKSFSKKILSN